MKRIDVVTTVQGAHGSHTDRRGRLSAMLAAGNQAPPGVVQREWLARRTLMFMVFLLVQFGLGMGINLFVSISPDHPGSDASNFLIGFIQSTWWGIVQGGLVVAIHTVLGLLITVSAAQTIAGAVQSGVRGAVIASGIGVACIVIAAICGAAFLTYQQDGYSLLMALGFGGAMLCYAITLYLYLVPQPTGKTAEAGDAS